MSIEFIECHFPNSKSGEIRITSDETPDYNCIAWALGKDNNWWWPSVDAYWPGQVLDDTSPSNFIRTFESLGYSVCSDGSFETGAEKIAIYTRDGEATHAAKLLETGKWTSKLGTHEDIEHDSLECLQGAILKDCGYGEVITGYGNATVFMKRAKT